MKKIPKRKATSHPMFKRWCCLRTWIKNASPTKYASYHGVGIDPGWHTFWTFADYIDAHWDTSILTSDDVFDRIDNNLPYQPGNVRFTDKKGNARSRVTTHYLTYKKQRRSISEWAEITGIPFSCILSRAYAGRTPEECLGLKG